MGTERIPLDDHAVVQEDVECGHQGKFSTTPRPAPSSKRAIDLSRQWTGIALDGHDIKEAFDLPVDPAEPCRVPHHNTIRSLHLLPGDFLHGPSSGLHAFTGLQLQFRHYLTGKIVNDLILGRKGW
jgi:hypothetical protein